MFNKLSGNHDDANTTTIDTSSECVLACFFIFSCKREFWSANALSSALGLRVTACLPWHARGLISHWLIAPDVSDAIVKLRLICFSLSDILFLDDPPPSIHKEISMFWCLF